MTKVMERSPHTFIDMGEEDIRQHFLIQLNGAYEGDATMEKRSTTRGKQIFSFVRRAKICLSANANFREDPKAFAETVDQLLSYLSWRDSKAAILIFNKNRNLTGVLNAIRDAMTEHPHKKRGPEMQGELNFDTSWATLMTTIGKLS